MQARDGYSIVPGRRPLAVVTTHSGGAIHTDDRAEVADLDATGRWPGLLEAFDSATEPSEITTDSAKATVAEALDLVARLNRERTPA